MVRPLLLSILAACNPSDGGEFPVEPGGPNPGGMGKMLDAAPIDAAEPDASAELTGRVCLVSDLRGLACAATGAAGITVTLGTQTATTLANGSFTMMTPSGSNLVWRASRNDLITSVMAFGPSKTIPIIGDQDYIDLQNANSVTLVAGEGSIVARIVRNNVAVSGAVVAISPVAQFAAKYDGLTSSAWTELSTSAAGTVWIPGAGLGANVVTATPPSGTPAMEAVVVEDQAITYVTIDLP
ncbi:MAG: hypothetical protein M4D80_39640 [Myxococcota bacterium]|nr:hypothetical protein [Myxococcota bacterium]